MNSQTRDGQLVDELHAENRLLRDRMTAARAVVLHANPTTAAVAAPRRPRYASCSSWPTGAPAHGKLRM